MGTINVYHDEDDKTYQVVATLKQGILSPELSTGGTGLTDAATEIYLEITTTIKKVDGSLFPKFIVRSLNDVAPGAATNPATSWTILMNEYVEYFLTTATLGMSSSTSSSSSQSSPSSSSSSSSEQYSSSSSSSDSTEARTTSSSSSTT